MNETITSQEIADQRIMYAPITQLLTSDLEESQTINIGAPYEPKVGYELVPPMETVASVSEDLESINIQAILYINSSHKITSLNVYEEMDRLNYEEKRIYIEFDKTVTNPTSDFITYLANFKIANEEKLKRIYIYLKSSNPRTSRGTVTTVKRPM